MESPAHGLWGQATAADRNLILVTRDNKLGKEYRKRLSPARAANQQEIPTNHHLYRFAKILQSVEY